MNNDDIKKRREQGWNDLWYVSRVLVGIILHVFMILCAFGFAEQAVEVMRMIPDHADAFSRLPPHLADVLIAVPAFTSAMAGAYWVKSLYVRYFLPEAMDEVTKKILGK